MDNARSAAVTPPTVVVTGGTGFVMSNLVRRLLETDPRATAIILDLGLLEGVVADFLEPVRDRVVSYCGDICDREVFERLSVQSPITHVVHAAAFTNFPRWERETPARYVTVNVLGTLNLLEWSRGLPQLRQFINVSTGGVYGAPTAASPTGPQPETGPFNPPELYAMTKYAGELIARRYGELFGPATASVRFSSVFGPMERPTHGRITMSLPYYMMRAVIEHRPLRITEQTLRAGGDFLSAEDIASAMVSMLSRPTLQYDAYNLAFGTFTTVEELFAAFRQGVPEFEYQMVAEGEAEYLMDPAQRLARWNAYTVDRARTEFGWTPRALSEQLATYATWVMQDPERRCPRLEVGAGPLRASWR